MMQKKIIISLLALFILINGKIWSQDFGFGFDNEESSGGTEKSNANVSISGEVSAAITGYFDEIADGAENINTRDMFMFSGKLNFFARSSIAEGAINIKLVPAIVPVSIDAAYISAFFGAFDISAGLKKITWGKADQLGPLDIINLPDTSRMFTEMSDNTNLMDIKIANPVIHTSYRFGMFSKIEGIFIPSFEIINMAVSTALSGDSDSMTDLLIGSVSERWIPAQMKELSQQGFSLNKADTSALNYTQAGIRFTTTAGRADIGFQYFYGRMYQPAFRFILPADTAASPAIDLIFNKYHQIGIDFAQVIAGLNTRSELAVNITEDTGGNDGFIYNPSIGWSFGFDRDLFSGINLNFQANGSIRLFNSKVGSSNNPFVYIYNEDFGFFYPIGYNPDFDIEAETSATATRFTAALSKKFLRDELEVRTAIVWGIEDSDFAFMPALIWTKNDLQIAFSCAFFAGDSGGQLGQYKDNSFMKISIKYTF